MLRDPKIRNGSDPFGTLLPARLVGSNTTLADCSIPFTIFVPFSCVSRTEQWFGSERGLSQDPMRIPNFITPVLNLSVAPR